MSNHVYKIVEVAGSSEKSIEDAIETAIKKASESLKNMAWFEVKETRGHLKEGSIAYYQVILKIGFTLKD